MAWFQKILSTFLGTVMAFMIGMAQAQYNPNQHDQDARDMLERCQDEGAIAVVAGLMKDNRKEWKEVLQKIAAGSRQWIETSACLSHGVFFGAKILAEDGDYAWATLTEAWPAALLKNPEALLKQRHEISLALMCSFPLYLVDHRDDSEEMADDFLEKALNSLERVEDDYLRASKEACVTYLKLDYKRYISSLEEYKKPH